MPQNSTTRRGRAIDGRTRDILTGVQIDGTHVRRTYTKAEKPVRVAACCASAILRMAVPLVVRMNRTSLATHGNLTGGRVTMNVAEIVIVSPTVDSLLPGQTAGFSYRPRAADAADCRH